MKKKILSLLLAVVMVVAMLPVTALAFDEGDNRDGPPSSGNGSSVGSTSYTVKASIDSNCNASSATFTLKENGYGATLVNGATSVNQAVGKSTTLTITAADGYYITGVTVNGEARNNVNSTSTSYTINNIKNNATVVVTTAARPAAESTITFRIVNGTWNTTAFGTSSDFTSGDGTEIVFKTYWNDTVGAYVYQCSQKVGSSGSAVTVETLLQAILGNNGTNYITPDTGYTLTGISNQDWAVNAGGVVGSDASAYEQMDAIKQNPHSYDNNGVKSSDKGFAAGTIYTLTLLPENKTFTVKGTINNGTVATASTTSATSELTQSIAYTNGVAGSSLAMTFTPAAGYSITGVTKKVNGIVDTSFSYSLNNDGTYTFSAISGVLSNYEINVTTSANKYTVTWKSQDGSETLETDTDVAYGTQPSFDGTAPTKAADEQYTYTFAGWSTTANSESGTAAEQLPTVSGNVTYYAAFSKSTRNYTVTWKSQDGNTTLETDTDVAYGTQPSFDGTAPTKAADEQYTYTFAGWSTTTASESGTAVSGLPTVTDDVTYYAAFSKSTNTYTVTWKSQDGNTTLETDSDVAYGTQPSFDTTAPTKAADAQYTYTFAGWSTEANSESGTAASGLPTVTDDVTYYAAFSKSTNTYTVTYNKGDHGSLDGQNADGNVIHSNVKYGATTPDAPSTTPDNGYYFTGWNPQRADTVTATVTYTAQWAKIDSATFDPANPTNADKEQGETVTPLVQKELTVADDSTLPEDGLTFTATIAPITATSENTFAAYTGAALTGTVTMTAADTKPFTFGTTDADGTATNNVLTFGEAGEYRFTVTETNGDVDGVTYDSKSYTLTVTVAVDGSDSGKLKVTHYMVAETGGSPTENTPITFANSYTEPEEETVSVQLGNFVTKMYVSSYGYPDTETFHFTATITGENLENAITKAGSVTLTTGNIQNVVFEEVALTNGTYTVTVTETKGTDGNIRYDDHVLSFTLTVEDYEVSLEEGGVEFTNYYTYDYYPYVPTPTINVKWLDTVNHVNYIVGRDNGLVDPEGTITRAEVATIYFRLMTDEWRNKFWSDECSFYDVADTAWYNVAVATLEKAGVIKDTVTGGAFRPDEPITRAELAVMAAQFCTVTGNIPKASFVDVPTTYWAYDEIKLIEYAGWIEGFAGYFRPDDNVKRADCVTIINRMLNRGAEPENMLSSMVTFEDNMDTTVWYYAAIQEAANTHTWTRTGKKLSGETCIYAEKWTAVLPATDWAALEKVWAEANRSR